MTEYNGWTNYETWAVMLWINNSAGSQDYWHEQARECWSEDSDTTDPSASARYHLAERLNGAHNDGIPDAVDGTVYADLLNAALSEVDWDECADSLLEDAGIADYKPKRLARRCAPSWPRR